MAIKNTYFFILIVLNALVFSACAHRTQSANTETTVPKIESSEEHRQKTFDVASAHMKNAEYRDALKYWRDYVSLYPASPLYEEALLQMSRALYFVGEHDSAIETLQPLIEVNHDQNIDIDARLLYAEILIQKNRLDEAIALTFDLLPDVAAEKRLGIHRKVKRPKPTLKQELRILTLRGRIFGEMNKEEEAVKTLRVSRMVLKGVTDEHAKYQALIAMRQIQTLGAICRNRVALPSALSEQEFLIYSSDYYSCIEPAKVFYCEVLGYEDEQIRWPAQAAYRELVMYPQKLENPLPPPSRLVKPEFKNEYEKEMKDLIVQTVEKRSKPFKNLESCNAFDVF